MDRVSIKGLQNRESRGSEVNAEISLCFWKHRETWAISHHQRLRVNMKEEVSSLRGGSCIDS